jgi:CRP-like cAMP-binding protein
VTSAPTDNKLLASLSKGDYELFQGDLEAVSLKLGETLCDSGRPLRYAYFPTTSIVSMNYLMQSGSSTEVAGIGFEGVVGHALFMSGESTTCSAVVQTAGLAYRLDKNVLLREFARGGGLRKILLRHVQSLMTQIGQTAVCNRHHSIDQQLCRWLLQTIDRLSGNELTMTQELISNMLGVRREAITEAAGRLQAAGCISYRRGHITVTNRKSLESRTCECYETVRSELKRLAAFDCGGRVH